MRLINEATHQIFFSYAGSSRRGVWLKPKQQSAELPPARLGNPALQTALKRGIVSLLMSPTDKVAARGIVPDAILELATGKPVAEAAAELDAERKDQVDKEAAEAKVAKEETEAAEKAAEEAKAKADKESAEAEAAKADADAAEKAAEEAKAKADKEDAEAKAAGEDADAAAAEARKAALAEAAVEQAQQYKKMKKPELLELCVSRNIAVGARVTVAELREKLQNDDARCI